MPETAPRTVRNRFGNVSVENLKATGDIVNSNGKLVFRRAAGASASRTPLARSTSPETPEIRQSSTATAPSRWRTSRGRSTSETGSAETSVTKVGKRCAVTAATATSRWTARAWRLASHVVRQTRARNVAGDLSVQNSNGSVTAAGVRDGRARVLLRRDRLFRHAQGSRGQASNSAVTAQRGRGRDRAHDLRSRRARRRGGPVEVENSNGTIRVRDVSAGVRLATRFAPIDAAGVGGDATVSNANGRCRSPTSKARPTSETRSERRP